MILLSRMRVPAEGIRGDVVESRKKAKHEATRLSVGPKEQLSGGPAKSTLPAEADEVPAEFGQPLRLSPEDPIFRSLSSLGRREPRLT